MTDSRNQEHQVLARYGVLRRSVTSAHLPAFPLQPQSVRLQPQSSDLRPHSSLLRPLSSILLCSFLLGPVAALAEYSYSADGSEVTDSITGLTWRRCSEGMAWSGGTCTGTAASYTHEGALQRATSEATASKAWRLPNVLELSSITKAGEAVNPSIDTTAFPQTPNSIFWSSSPYVYVSDASSAWNVDFSNGVVSGFNASRYVSYKVRLVR